MQGAALPLCRDVAPQKVRNAASKQLCKSGSMLHTHERASASQHFFMAEVGVKFVGKVVAAVVSLIRSLPYYVTRAACSTAHAKAST